MGILRLFWLIVVFATHMLCCWCRRDVLMLKCPDDLKQAVPRKLGLRSELIKCLFKKCIWNQFCYWSCDPYRGQSFKNIMVTFLDRITDCGLYPHLHFFPHHFYSECPDLCGNQLSWLCHNSSDVFLSSYGVFVWTALLLSKRWGYICRRWFESSVATDWLLFLYAGNGSPVPSQELAHVAQNKIHWGCRAEQSRECWFQLQ